MSLLLRTIKIILLGLRPISTSLASISVSLHTIARIQSLRLRLEHNEILTDEKLERAPRDQDQTELSWAVKEPEINPETGKPIVEDDNWSVDWNSIFGKGGGGK